MGLISDVRELIRRMLQNDTDAQRVALARGYDDVYYEPDGLGGVGAYGGYGGVQGTSGGLGSYFNLEYDLMARYLDYEYMDEYSEIGTGLDIYADNSTQPHTPSGKQMWVTSPDPAIAMMGNDLFDRQMRTEDNLWDSARALCTYGNYFGELTVMPGKGVIQMRSLPAVTMRRIEGMKGELYGFVQDFQRRVGYTPSDFFQLLQAAEDERVGIPDPREASYDAMRERPALPFEDWSIVHMRLSTKSYRSAYGYAVTEPARYAWKRLVMMEDAALLHRLQRAPERYVYYVEVGDRPAHEARRLMNDFRRDVKRKKYIDPKTKQIRMRFDLLAQDEDLFIPTVQGQGTSRVETLQSPRWESTEDLEYFRSKVFAAIKIPKAYLAQDQQTSRQTLSNEDVQFARTIMRIQRELRAGYMKVLRIHFASLGMEPHRMPYDVQLTVPSTILELAQMEVRNAKADLMQRLGERFSDRWLMQEVWGLNDKDVDQIFEQREADVERRMVAQAKGQAAAAEFNPEGGGGGGGFYASRSRRYPAHMQRILDQDEADQRAPRRPELVQEAVAESPWIANVGRLLQDIRNTNRSRSRRGEIHADVRAYRRSHRPPVR